MKLNDVLDRVNESALDSLIYKLGEKIENMFSPNKLNEATFSKESFDGDMNSINEMIAQINNILSKQGNLKQGQFDSYAKSISDIFQRIKNDYPAFIEKVTDPAKKDALTKALQTLSKKGVEELQLLKSIKSDVTANNPVSAVDNNGVRLTGTSDYIKQQQANMAATQQKLAAKNAYDPNQMVNTKV